MSVLIKKINTETGEEREGLIKIENLEPGIKDAYFVHEQTSPSDIWTINHNLGKNPSVSIVDSAGSVVLGDIEITNTNSLKLKFAGAFSGKAYCN